jgi:hypothetical protein
MRTLRVAARMPISTFLSRLVAACLLAGPLSLPAQAGAPADALRERHAALAPQLARNPYGRPMHIESTQTSGDLKGEVYAVVDHPFATLDRELRSAAQWCEILILHLNVKHCRASGNAPNSMLAVSIGKKHDQALADAHRVNFEYQLASATPDYLKIMLDAKQGPLGTRDYRILVEAIPLDAGRSFVHMSYAYGYGLAARLAMQGYLGTIGSGKVGFSVVEQRPDGQPVYVDNVRGVVERNAMRYFLALDAYLASLSAPPAERQERRLRDWFAATERHARQLRELERDDYLAMKRKEIQRQQAGVQTAKNF